MDKDMDNLNSYLEFLKFCINDNRPVPSCIKDIKWHSLLEFGVKHTISGIFAPTVLMKNGKLTINDFQGNKPSDEDVMEWVFEDYRLRKLNTTMFERTQKASEWFYENGFRNCILKGQANAIMYPDPYLRTSGDIDIWLEGSRDKILEFTTKYYNRPATRLHVDFPMFRDVQVEVHFHPSSMLSPIKNKQLWKYFDSVADAQFNHKATSPDGKYSFYVPTNEFNLFYQIDHIFRHLVVRGIGLRQIIDYFFLLRKRYNDGATPEDDKQLIKTLNKFNLHRFSRAMMYILHEVLGLDEKYLYTKPHEKEGKFLLSEILEGGNFGKYESRLDALVQKDISRDSSLLSRSTSVCFVTIPVRSCGDLIWISGRDCATTWVMTTELSSIHIVFL